MHCLRKRFPAQKFTETTADVRGNNDVLASTLASSRSSALTLLPVTLALFGWWRSLHDVNVNVYVGSASSSVSLSSVGRPVGVYQWASFSMTLASVRVPSFSNIASRIGIATDVSLPLPTVSRGLIYLFLLGSVLGRRKGSSHDDGKTWNSLFEAILGLFLFIFNLTNHAHNLTTNNGRDSNA